MSMNELCVTLQHCVEKFEEQIKYDLNELQNVVSSQKLDDVKLSLEKAKNYHYEEITSSTQDLMKIVEKITFHMKQIDWLNDEQNINKETLRNFSYVQRQVFAFSQNGGGNNNSPSILRPMTDVKRNQRKSTSLDSIGSLETWENYLENKEKENKEIDKKIENTRKGVVKRTQSDAKKRKKFVSSTMEVFLDQDREVLDPILEDAFNPEDADVYVLVNESDCGEDNIHNSDQRLFLSELAEVSEASDNVNRLKNNNFNINNKMSSNVSDSCDDCVNESNEKLSHSRWPAVADNVKSLENNSLIKNTEISSNKIKETHLFGETVNGNQIVDSEEILEGNIDKSTRKNNEEDRAKPRVIQLIYKKDPS